MQVVIPIPSVIMITPSRKQFLFYCTRPKVCAVRRKISHITHSILKYFCIHTITFADRVHSAFGRHPGNQNIRQWNPYQAATLGEMGADLSNGGGGGVGRFTSDLLGIVT